MKVAVKNWSGEQVSEVDLPEAIFNAEVNVPLMHQALLRQNANAHLGTHKTKTRAEVNRTTKKVYKQKGTGNARQGSRKAPHWVGGGTAFGPVVHDYIQDMPKKMRRAAIRSALTQKLKDEGLVVVENFESVVGKTKDLSAALKTLGVNKGLIVLPTRVVEVERAARNLPNFKSLQAGYLNIRDIFSYDGMVVSLDALKKIEEWLA